MTDTEPLLDVRDVTLTFGGLTALDQVSFCIEAGQVVAAIGPNGAGKSSLLNVLSGLYRPTAGRVVFGGKDLLGLAPERIARLGLSRTFQNLGLFESMTVIENVLVGRTTQLRRGAVAGSLWWGRSRREETHALDTAFAFLERVGLADLHDAAVGSLPYGTKKRVELAKALANGPRVLLLDEPVAGMNPEESAQIAETIRLARDELGTAILLIEHDLPIVMDLADRVLVLDFGRVVSQGTPAEVQADPEVLRAYTGDFSSSESETADIR